MNAQPFPLNITHSLLGSYHHRVHREKIENEKSLSIFKKILCLVFSIPLSVRSVFSVVKILAGTIAWTEHRRNGLNRHYGQRRRLQLR